MAVYEGKEKILAGTDNHYIIIARWVNRSNPGFGCCAIYIYLILRLSIIQVLGPLVLISDMRVIVKGRRHLNDINKLYEMLKQIYNSIMNMGCSCLNAYSSNSAIVYV